MTTSRKLIKKLIEKANKRKGTLIFFYALLADGRYQDIMTPDSKPITERQLDKRIELHDPDDVIIDDIP